MLSYIALQVKFPRTRGIKQILLRHAALRAEIRHVSAIQRAHRALHPDVHRERVVPAHAEQQHAIRHLFAHARQRAQPRPRRIGRQLRKLAEIQRAARDRLRRSKQIARPIARAQRR